MVRSIWRCQKYIYYQNLDGEGITDEFGNYREKSYGEIRRQRVSITAQLTEVHETPYGKGVDYDRSIISHDKKFIMDEYSYVWVDADPKTEPHDYEVQRVANTPNARLYELKKVSVG